MSLMFQILYMVRGVWTLFTAEYATIEQVTKAFRSLKARGYTCRVVDGGGKHVPVKGAMRAPKLSCMCGASEPPTETVTDGLPRCIYCGCH